MVADVEAVKLRSLPSLVVTGLAGDMIRESRERVSGCLANLGFSDVPSGRLVVHLFPANEKKQGTHFDLAIALTVLAAEGHIPLAGLSSYAVVGELTLEGRIRGAPGIVPLLEVLAASPANQRIIVPSENEAEASLIASARVGLASHLSEVISEMKGGEKLRGVSSYQEDRPGKLNREPFGDIVGQSVGKRAVQIAVAGRHHLLLIGSPGVGKSLLAHASDGLQPPLSRNELLETLRCNEISQGMFSFKRPFRSPHHSVTAAAFLGGGAGALIAGEVTLAHRGILFLDEFPEFRRDAIEGLREPLESGVIHLHRVGWRMTLPARFTLIASMNPCPCGYALEGNRCRCNSEKRMSYARRISGPILDRMDLGVILDRPDPTEPTRGGETGVVGDAVERQKFRYRDRADIDRNGDVRWDNLNSELKIPPEAESWVRALEQRPVSLRSLHKTLKVGRTIADIEGEEDVTRGHVHEAWELRCRFSSNASISA